MSKRGRQAVNKSPPKGGRKKVKEEVDYSLYEDIANQLRIDCLRAVHVSKSGHPTSSASIAEILTVLFFHPAGAKIHIDDHKHPLNDRIVLSKGHAAPGLYAAFYRAGLITEHDLLSLRVKDSIIQGHPTPEAPFVDVATGSLGQGLSVAAGLAYSCKYFQKNSNHIFCICGDGQLAEGSIWEAASFSSYYKLNNLVLFADINALGQSQQTMFQHNLQVYRDRFSAFGFATHVVDGHSIAALESALNEANKQTDKPTVIICKTLKGKGFVEKIEGKMDWHGKDLGALQEQTIAGLKSRIKHDPLEFKTYAPVGNRPVVEKGVVSITPNYESNAKISTRKAYGKGLLKARESNPNVIGLDGDTKNSTFSHILYDKYPQSFIECFIAQQNMVGVATGLACRGKIAFCSTFATFFSRAADQVRIAGISRSTIKMAGSHTGCTIGEDGPSQMALQDMAFFRTLPNSIVLIPSDGVSAQKAVELAANYNDGPAYIRTARPETEVLYKNDQTFVLGQLKVVKTSPTDRVVIITGGVTLAQSLRAYETLIKEGVFVRVIDIFSLKPLDEKGLRTNIEAVGGNVLVVEDHYPEGGIGDAVCSATVGTTKKFAHLCVRKIPGSAKPEEQVEIHNIGSHAIIAKVKQLLL